jgi:uncharacterized membrane protein YphA (DoxX/SURF4 family)
MNTTIAQPAYVKVLLFLPNIIAAIILLQTLFFKFTGAPESVYIFTTVGMEPVGRIGSGIVELIAAVLLLWPSKAWIGAVLASSTMVGAIASHLFLLGIEVMGDGGELFALAVTVQVCCLFILWLNLDKILAVLPFKLK